MITDDELKALSTFASKDLARPVLMGINFTDTLAEATDGYKMAWLSYEGKEEAKTYPRGIVPAFDIAEAIKLKGKSPKPLEYKGNTIKAGGYTKEYKPIEGQFPNTSSVIDKLKGKKAVRIGLDIKLLSSILQAFKMAGDNFIELAIVPDDNYGSLNPLLVKGLASNKGKSGLRAVLMPIRIAEGK